MFTLLLFKKLTTTLRGVNASSSVFLTFSKYTLLFSHHSRDTKPDSVPYSDEDD